MEARGGNVNHAVSDPNGLSRSGARHLLFLVHGFNNTKQNADEAYERYFGAIREDLRKSKVAPDAVAEFHWPGDIAVGPWRFAPTDAVAYPQDITQALQSAASLARYLGAFPPPGPDAGSLKVSLVGHSLGCRLILEALTQLPPPSRPEIVLVSLMAAAVGVSLVATGRPQAAAAGAKRVVKFWSTRDWVLRLAFPTGQAAAFAQGIEGELHGEAVGRFGNPSSFGKGRQTANGHSQYWPDAGLAMEIVPAIDASLPRALPPPIAIPANPLPSRDSQPPREMDRRNLPS
jgi:pimeloyl-ACP methyl ester carboxylesterase